MLSRAHFKAGKPWQERILCGRVNRQGCRNCRGELGRLLLKEQGGLFTATPLVVGTMARDSSMGWYRVTRQRRPHRSGIEGGLNVGGGVTTAHLLHDKQGQPLKMLQPLYAEDGHVSVVLVCPRCDVPNEVHLSDLARQQMERRTAPH